MDDIGAAVRCVIFTLEERLTKRSGDLAQRQPTNGDWDKFFHYLMAAHHANNSRSTNINNKKDPFEIDDVDKAQASKEAHLKTLQVLADDEEDGDTPPSNKMDQGPKVSTALKQKRKRNPSPRDNLSNYRIPKGPDSL